MPWPEEKLWKIEDALPRPSKIVSRVGAGLGLRQMEALAFSPDDINRRNRLVDILHGCLRHHTPYNETTA